MIKHKRGKRKRSAVSCECGLTVAGISEANVISNLNEHLKSKLHKRMIILKKDISSGLVTEVKK